MVWRCQYCGAVSNVMTRPANHQCDENKYVAHQVGQFEPAFKNFLSTKRGRFMTYYAKWLINGQGIPQGD